MRTKPKNAGRLVSAVASASVAALLASTAVPAAQASTGVCGYYGESYAFNEVCTNSLRSWGKAGGINHFGPFVSKTNKSWQSQNYPGIEFASYQVQLS